MRSQIRGCWTCRARHVKCDLKRPLCKECDDRHVQCHGYGERPAWMDGAVEEAKERSRIKQAVKKNFRRVRTLQNRASRSKGLPIPGIEIKASEPISTSELSVNRDRSKTTVPKNRSQSELIVSSCAHETSDVCLELVGPNRDDDHGAFQSPETLGTTTSRKPTPSISPQEASLLMHYFDEVIPWQFPYHCPRSYLGNRGWLLSLFTQRGPLYHAALSLSSLHQSALRGNENEYKENEKACNYYARALRELCVFLTFERQDNILNNIGELTEFLACSMMLISLEIFRGGEHDWQPHLQAVTSLLRFQSPKNIFNKHSNLNFNYSSSEDDIGLQGLRFLMVTMLWIDLFACISTGKPPHLPYQQWLSTPGFHMEELIGCRNWVMSLIGDLAVLDDWKQSKEKEGALSVRELAMKSLEIETRLEHGLVDLDLTEEFTISEKQCNWVTRIFALAALVLLHTIVSGTIPTLPEIQDAVNRSVVALQQRPKGFPPTGLVWALWVTGRMATGDAQQFFEEFMLNLQHDSKGIGNCGTVLKNVRECWASSEEHQDCRTTTSRIDISILLI